MTVQRQAPDLSERDRRILADLRRVRLLTGAQLERLHFARLASRNARSSSRRRTMTRLVSQRLVVTLPRRVGGERAGSAGLVYTLDSLALRHPELWQPGDQPAATRIRRPWRIGWLFVAHTLDVSELYVRLRERERDGMLTLLRFAAEPAAWYEADGRMVKPDAYAVYETGNWEQHRWIEVDRATESLPTVRRKLMSYLDLAHSRVPGPVGVLPQVLVTVPNERRLKALAGLITNLPAPAAALLRVKPFANVFGASARPPP